jgi:hypothetical protein
MEDENELGRNDSPMEVENELRQNDSLMPDAYRNEGQILNENNLTTTLQSIKVEPQDHPLENYSPMPDAYRNEGHNLNLTTSIQNIKVEPQHHPPENDLPGKLQGLSILTFDEYKSALKKSLADKDPTNLQIEIIKWLQTLKSLEIPTEIKDDWELDKLLSFKKKLSRKPIARNKKFRKWNDYDNNIESLRTIIMAFSTTATKLLQKETALINANVDLDNAKIQRNEVTLTSVINISELVKLRKTLAVDRPSAIFFKMQILIKEINASINIYNITGILQYRKQTFTKSNLFIESPKTVAEILDSKIRNKLIETLNQADYNFNLN